MQQPDLVQIFLASLEKNEIPYFVTGSTASIFYGEPRLTHDIDLVLNLASKDIERFISLFPIVDFYCPPAEVIQIELKRKPFGHFNLIHHNTGLKADIYTASEDPLHEWAFEHRRRVLLGEGFSIWIAPPEYVIIRKLEYFREGGSTKHIEDISKMLPQIDRTLDRRFLGQEIKQRLLEPQSTRVKGLFPSKKKIRSRK